MKPSPSSDLIGMRVSRETMDRLDRFAIVFSKWAATINLVAPSTKGDLWHRHIADSAHVFQTSPEPKQWVDLGSGGGFPGIITAIFLAELQNGWVHLVESNHKKIAFLRAAIVATGARASVYPIRIEDAPVKIPHCDAISARALADLSQLLEFCLPWMLESNTIKAFFHKGRDYQREIDKAVGRFNFDLVKHQSVIEDDSVLLEISKLSRHPHPTLG